MKYVFAAIIFTLTLLLTSCGPGRDFSKFVHQTKTSMNNLTGGQDSLGNSFTGFSPPLDQVKMKEQISQAPDNITFAQNIEAADALIDKQDLKVTVKWRNIDKPLEFQGRLLPKGNEFAGELLDTTNQRTDLKITATCNDGACSVISAFIEDKDNHKAGFIIRQEERELDVRLTDEKLKTLSKQKQDIFESLRKNNKVIVTSTEIFPGKSSFKIKSNAFEGNIQGDLLETNNGAVNANAVGKIAELGRVALVGNTNSGELVLKVSNEVDARIKKEEPSWLKKWFSKPKEKVEEETQKETINAFLFFKPREKNVAAEQVLPTPQPVNTEEPQPIQVPVQEQKLAGLQAHELVKQVLAEAQRKELKPFIESWVQYNKEQITIHDLSNNGRLHRFLLMHEKMQAPFKVSGTDEIKNMVKILRKNNLPAAVSMLSYVESGFYPQAKSNKEAVGWWQFIASTGASYGLVGFRNNEILFDKRSDLKASTQAASEYLNYLLKFWDGDLKMALASYNAGEGRMSFQTTHSRGEKNQLEKKLKRDGVPLSEIAEYTKDFWILSYYNSIPAETKKHVPKIISGIVISLDPKSFKIDAQPLDLN